MKPLILKMKAFGSYAEETIVDFNALDSGLYLITGDTGAGKTTIFDAMVFALYGVASGTGRDGAEFHSDFVDKSIDTVVSLEFIHHNKKYKVERKIHFPKSRNGSDYGKPTINALFNEVDTNKTIEKPTEVTSRVTEIIGLDANQFKQIIVLAQGEFQKFLTASSEERNVILGKLFDNTPYVRFQNRLKEASKMVEDKVKTEEQFVKVKMDSFMYPENEDNLLYSIENPNCIKNIEELVKKEKEEKEQLDSQYTKTSEEEKTILVKKTTKENQNNELDRLKIYENNYQNLLEQKNGKDEQNNNLLIVEKVYREVSPLKKSYKDASVRYKNNENEIRITSEKLEVSSKKKDKAIQAYSKVSELNDENTKLATELDHLNNQLEKFKPFNEKKKEWNNHNNALNHIQREIDNLKVKQSEFELTKKKLEDEISAKQQIADQYADRKIAYDKANKQYDSLIKKDGLMNKIDEVNQEKKLIDLLNREVLDLNLKVQEKKKIYDDLYSSFLKSQANRLAKELKIKLESESEADCPVCRHHLSRTDIKSLVVDEEKIITSEEVDDAKNIFDVANTKLKDKEASVKTKEAEVNTLKKSTLDYAKQMNLDITTYDDLTTDFITNLKVNLSKEKDEKQQLFTLSEQAKKALDQLEQSKKTNETKLQENTDKLNKKNEEKNNQSIQLTKIKTELENIEKELNGLTEDVVKTSIQNTVNKINSNNNEVKNLTKDKEDAEKEYSANKGELNSLNNTQKSLELDLKHKKEEYQNALTENHLNDENDYENVISVALPDVSKWIKDTREDIQSYQTNLQSCKNQLNEQKEKCKDFEYSDIAKIDEELKEIQSKINELTSLREKANNLYLNHQDILGYIRKKYENIHRYQPIKERLLKLASLANATNSTDGGKITFDRYVMGNAFGEILSAANKHLAVMASGQFELIHQTKAAANKQTGLDISVLDIFTGEQRKPETLSGGEKFQVSMALALGLSDVVQNHAGGKKIDTMYIDEGFGTLDESVLSKAIEVLKNIAGENRQIGIISHVERLEESIPQKIVVTKSDKGSSLRIVK